jgi:asparagine synthase (glutamine-hydrolysing)
MGHLEEPRMGQSYPNFYAAQLASKFVKVVLSGCGGDEMFGGYPWRYYRSAAAATFEEYVQQYSAYWQRLIPSHLLPQFFAPIWQHVSVRTDDVFRSVFVNHENELRGPADYINHSLYFEAKTFLHGLLVLEDKMSMAHGLETRVPFLDNDLVEFAMRLPVSCKLAHVSDIVRIDENEPGLKNEKYFQRTRDGKLLLRSVMARHVPPEISESAKQGFSGPDASWFRGESIEYVKREVLSPRARIYEFLDRGTVHALVDDHLQGRENRRLLIWSLLCFEQWLRGFMKA